MCLFAVLPMTGSYSTLLFSPSFGKLSGIRHNDEKVPRLNKLPFCMLLIVIEIY